MGRCRGHRPGYAQGCFLHKRFYEKVIKVKADVAAVFDYFFPSCIDLRWVTWGAVKGAAERGAFILTLTAPQVTYNRARNEAKRSSVELRSLVE